MELEIDPDDLKGFRGSPFDPSIINAAVESIRVECGWQIGPETTTTEHIETDGKTLFLSTLKLLEVEEIVDAENDSATPVTGRYRAKDNGVVKALGKTEFPEYARVTYRHGHKEFPRTLLPIVAERARNASQGRLTGESLASRSITIEGGRDPLTAPLLAAYRLGKRPSA